MTTTNEIRKAVRAFDRDKQLLFRRRDRSTGWQMTQCPSWNFLKYEYKPYPLRIKGYIGIIAMTRSHPPETTPVLPTRDHAHQYAREHAYRLATIVEVDCEQTENLDF